MREGICMQQFHGASALKVDEVEYRGWKNALRIYNDTVELVVLTEVGPRILFFGFRGEPNEFHEVPEHAGKTGGEEFRSYGGHRLWVSPEVERTYYPDNFPVSIRRHNDVFGFAAPAESSRPGTNLQKDVEINLDKTGTHVSVTHRITNRGKEATEMAPWALSVMAEGGKAILPLPPKAPFNKDRLLPEGILALWSYTDLADPRWKIGSKYIQLRQDKNPTGQFKEQMTGIFNPSGWGVYYRQGHLFVKRAEVQRSAKYPDFGCNFELYTDPCFLELETLGPLRNLEPGQTVEHTEEWWLFKSISAGEDDTWVDSVILPILETAR
jgi:hypothetical protein